MGEVTHDGCRRAQHAGVPGPDRRLGVLGQLSPSIAEARGFPSEQELRERFFGGLFEAAIAASGRPAPKPRSHAYEAAAASLSEKLGGDVTIESRLTFAAIWGRAEDWVDVTLNSSVPWSIEINGGLERAINIWVASRPISWMGIRTLVRGGRVMAANQVSS